VSAASAQAAHNSISETCHNGILLPPARLLPPVQGEAAAAINWVLKDGAGRLGRFLFARWGRELDCELKQFRLAGDLLMEAGEENT
jgi:hypothetical protein